MLQKVTKYLSQNLINRDLSKLCRDELLLIMTQIPPKLFSKTYHTMNPRLSKIIENNERCKLIAADEATGDSR